MTYRRRKDSETWHWRLECERWPDKNYVEATLRPKTGTLCGRCTSKERKHTPSLD